MIQDSFPKTADSLEESIRSLFGSRARILSQERLLGGDINDAYRIRLSTGDELFLKTNLLSRADFFLREAGGLKALGASGQIGIPRLLGIGTDARRGIAFLALEYLTGASQSSSYWETFGHQLAALHRSEARAFLPSASEGARYGFYEDNYIGSSPQKNTPAKRWIDFYRDCRLRPQLQAAETYFDASLRKKADILLKRLDTLLREPAFPSLLHGDLWGGNVLCGPDGRAWLIDPAVSVGDFEADLAMTQLFGSFPERFYAAYSEINPIDRNGYNERRGLYQLYHLLNHLNLFGTAYLGSVAAVLEAYAG